MARPYKVLRNLMRNNDLTNELFGKMLGIATSTVSNKLNGHFPWTSDEMWTIMELFDQPANKFHEIFPMNGQNESGAVRKTIRRPA